MLQIYEPLKASKKLEVLAFPCDSFMHQEKGTHMHLLCCCIDWSPLCSLAMQLRHTRADARAPALRRAGDTAEVCSFAARKGAKWPVFDKARTPSRRNHPTPAPHLHTARATCAMVL